MTHESITPLDYFAGLALQALVAKYPDSVTTNAEQAYAQAHAMLRVRGGEQAGPAPEVDSELLNAREAAAIFGVTVGGLLKWTKEGILLSYRIGGKIYYKKHEMMAAVKPRIPS